MCHLADVQNRCRDVFRQMHRQMVIQPHDWKCLTNIIHNMKDHEYLLVMYNITDVVLL